jgi:hypothetical protein
MPQIRAEQQPVTQITVVEAEPGKQAEALDLMTQRAQFMARQPGFVSRRRVPKPAVAAQQRQRRRRARGRGGAAETELAQRASP